MLHYLLEPCRHCRSSMVARQSVRCPIKRPGLMLRKLALTLHSLSPIGALRRPCSGGFSRLCFLTTRSTAGCISLMTIARCVQCCVCRRKYQRQHDMLVACNLHAYQSRSGTNRYFPGRPVDQKRIAFPNLSGPNHSSWAKVCARLVGMLHISVQGYRSRDVDGHKLTLVVPKRPSIIPA